jgi:hypothetical protein
VRPLRAFPLSAPDVNVVLIDGEDNELGMIRDLKALDADSYEVLRAELELAYLFTKVREIRWVRSRFGVTTWSLETDRGARTAHVKERSDIRTMPDGRTVLTDVHGIQYEIPPPDQLDERTRGYIDIET